MGQPAGSGWRLPPWSPRCSCAASHWTRGYRTPSVALTDQMIGFRRYLSTAEADQLRFEEGVDIFSKLPPWAIMFDVADRWQQSLRRAGGGREGFPPHRSGMTTTGTTGSTRPTPRRLRFVAGERLGQQRGIQRVQRRRSSGGGGGGGGGVGEPAAYGLIAMDERRAPTSPRLLFTYAACLTRAASARRRPPPCRRSPCVAVADLARDTPGRAGPRSPSAPVGAADGRQAGS